MKLKLPILLFALTLFQFSTFAQNEYFENNPIWGVSVYCQYAPFAPITGRQTTYFVNGDTLLNDEVYVKIFEEGLTYNGLGTNWYSETPYSFPSPMVYLRSEEMKMFKWNEELSVKVLLCDFDVAVGEPFYTSPTESLNPLIVVSISTITLGGIERKIITATPDGAESGYWSQYVEGVGHWRGGIWEINGSNDISCYSNFTCFSLNGESYFVNTDLNPWFVPSTEVCEFVVGLNEIATPQIKVYPNPTSDDLNIQCGSTIRSIEIFDLTGRVVLARQTNGKVIKIDTESLKTGSYYLGVSLENGIIKTMKFQKY